jgi:hypothetical protein
MDGAECVLMRSSCDKTLTLSLSHRERGRCCTNLSDPLSRWERVGVRVLKLRETYQDKTR